MHLFFIIRKKNGPRNSSSILTEKSPWNLAMGHNYGTTLRTLQLLKLWPLSTVRLSQKCSALLNLVLKAQSSQAPEPACPGSWLHCFPGSLEPGSKLPGARRPHLQWGRCHKTALTLTHHLNCGTVNTHDVHPFLHWHVLHCHEDPHLSGPISFYTCAFLQRPLEPQRAKLIHQVSLSCWNYFLSCLSAPFSKSNASAFSSRKSPTSTPQAHHSSIDTGTRALTLPSTGANNWRSRWHLAPETGESPAHLPLQEASFLNCSRLSTPPGREERNNVIIIKPQHRHKYLFWGCFVDTMS